MPDPTKPLKISDKKEYERRQQAYNDSLDSYNSTIGVFRDVFPGYKGDIEDLWDINDRTNIKDEELKNALNSGDLDIVWNKEKLLRESSDLGYKGIAPEWVLSSRGGTMEKFFFKKPTQPVEYVSRDSYQLIPIIEPTLLPQEEIPLEELKTVPVQNAYVPPKDARRFTAGNYLESQGKPSGYVNYGDNTGRKDVYQDGGVVLNNDDRSIDSFYTDQQAKSLGFQVSYPYKTLQNPEYKDIRIPQQNPHFMEPLREKKIQYRQVPMNIEDGTSMLDNNNDIGFLFNKKFGIQ